MTRYRNNRRKTRGEVHYDDNMGHHGENTKNQNDDHDDQRNDHGDLKISPISSSKDKIKHPKLSKDNVIPKLGTSSIFVGATGMGKSTLLQNLIMKPQFLGAEGTFDFKFLVSPTAEGDDVQKEMGIDKEFVMTNLKSAPKLLNGIMSEQKKTIKRKGNHESPQVLLIYDDIISDPNFLREDSFIQTFIASRHYNLTTMICTQSWTAVPRKCRLQARNIFFFASAMSEMEKLAEEYSPPGLRRSDFIDLVDYATEEPFSFLYINKSAQMEDRFRKNLGEIINLDQYRETKRGVEK